MNRRASIIALVALGAAAPFARAVESPSTYEIFVNLKTAKAIGIAIPPAVLMRTDRVIE